MRSTGKNSYVVLPYLKTSRPVELGGLTLGGVDGFDNLDPADAAHLRSLSSMLFLRDDVRIPSPTFGIVPYIDLDGERAELSHLVHVRDYLAYLYSSPRHEFGDTFLSSEHASLHVFSPCEVPTALLGAPALLEDDSKNLTQPRYGSRFTDGYAGYYELTHPFWSARGSRLYGPVPHMILNLTQDLSHDLESASAARPDHRLLQEALARPRNDAASRAFSAVGWYCRANEADQDESVAILNLAVAFEALLALPRADKTSRVVDSISLLLGRTPRLDEWARQFYKARSQVAHEGGATALRFVPGARRSRVNGQYQSLISYGREVFQLCVGVVLAGAELAEGVQLDEMLVSNQERFHQICIAMLDESVSARERLESLAPLVSAIEQYRYVPDSGLEIGEMLGALKLVGCVLHEASGPLDGDLGSALDAFVAAPRGADHFRQLDALRKLDEQLSESDADLEGIPAGRALRDLVHVVWGMLFIHFFYLQGMRTKTSD